MSRYGVIVAGQFAEELPTFADHSEAEESLFAQRDMGLHELLLEDGLTGNLDYSPESLQLLEGWFFKNGQPAATTAGFSMPHAIAFYFGEVLCRARNFGWVVQEFTFVKGRYEIGVQRPLQTIMLTKGRKLPVAGNKQMRSLWREFQRYTP